VEQSGKWRLPNGPCICAPDRLLAALHREVILRKPQEFKIAVLSDVRSLFPENPFYAGFGNRISVALSLFFYFFFLNYYYSFYSSLFILIIIIIIFLSL